MVAVGDPEVERLLRIYRNQGMERRYENEVVGLNARMSDIHAAIGRVQLTRVAAWTRRRQDNAARLDAELSGVTVPSVARGGRARLPPVHRAGARGPGRVRRGARAGARHRRRDLLPGPRAPACAVPGRTSTCRRPNAPRASASRCRSTRRSRPRTWSGSSTLSTLLPPRAADGYDAAAGPGPDCCPGRTARGAARGLSPRAAPRQGCPDQAAFLVSQKISAIWSILASSSSALARSLEPLVPVAPASLVASLKRVCSSGYFSKCGGLK